MYGSRLFKALLKGLPPEAVVPTLFLAGGVYPHPSIRGGGRVGAGGIPAAAPRFGEGRVQPLAAVASAPPPPTTRKNYQYLSNVWGLPPSRWRWESIGGVYPPATAAGILGRRGSRPPPAAVAVRTCQVGGVYPPPRCLQKGGCIPPRAAPTHLVNCSIHWMKT